MLDQYFKKPIFWDYAIASIVTCVAFILCNYHLFLIPKEEYLISIASDLSTISLTLAGFILTLMTVLISFKASNETKKNNDAADLNLFEMFFNSKLYFQTVQFLKNGIKSLIFISVLGYVIKLLFNQGKYHLLYFYNYFGLVIIVLTLWRSLIILTKIIKIQEEDY